MSINHTIDSLGEELSKLFQKLEKLKEENKLLVQKNQELEAQFKSSFSEQGNAGEKLVQYVSKLKTYNEEESEQKSEQKDGTYTENLKEINPENDLL